ncbi:MAG: radical SAM protein [Deltaproteobacteria bacterium]|nr:radical SAM protein [Deltaproteobacteria bacterium]
MRLLNFPDAYLVLELTNQCPLACTHCIQGRRADFEHFKEPGFMDPALVARLLDDLAENGIRFNDVILFWLGEPLLHPQFQPIYKSVVEASRKAHLFNTVTVHTNAVRLSDEIVRLAVENADVRQQWHFSLDAATPATYLRVKGKDLFAPVVENVTRMVQARADARAKFPRLVFQFIVRGDNRGEAGEFAAHWKRFLASHELPCDVVAPNVPPGDRDCVFFRQLDCLDASEQDAADAVYREVLAEVGVPLHAGVCGIVAPCAADSVKPPAIPGVLSACSGFFKSPTVNWDGRVTVCTRDSGLLLEVGDISQDPFSKVWWENPRLHSIRRAVARGDYAGLDFCRGCIIPRSHNYTGIARSEIDDYLRL